MNTRVRHLFRCCGWGNANECHTKEEDNSNAVICSDCTGEGEPAAGEWELVEQERVSRPFTVVTLETVPRDELEAMDG